MTRARRYFEDTLAYLNARDCEPLLILTPVHPKVMRVVRNDHWDSLHASLLAYFKEQQKRFHFTVLDFTFISSFKGDPAAFYDASHMKESNMRRLLDAAVRKAPWAFGKGDAPWDKLGGQSSLRRLARRAAPGVESGERSLTALRVVLISGEQPEVAGVAALGDSATAHGVLHGAAGFVRVRAVAVAAARGERREFREALGDARRVHVVHAEAADARRVDHAHAAGQLVQAGRRGGVAAAAVAGAHRAGLCRGLLVQGVQQRRLAHAALPDEHAGGAGEHAGRLSMPSPVVTLQSTTGMCSPM